MNITSLFKIGVLTACVLGLGGVATRAADSAEDLAAAERRLKFDLEDIEFVKGQLQKQIELVESPNLDARFRASQEDELDEMEEELDAKIEAYNRTRDSLLARRQALARASESASSQADGAAEGGYRITGVPAGDTLNIRSGPGMNFPVAGELPNGKDGIQITGDAVMNGEAEWVPISYPGGKGWVRTKYLARAGGSSSGSGGGSAPAASSGERKILRSTLHGLTLSVKLPSDMTEIEVMDKATVNENRGGNGAVLKDIVFHCLKTRKSSVILNRVISSAAEQRPTAKGVMKEEFMHLERAAAPLGTVRGFNGTFLGKPALAVLINYKAGLPEKSWMMFSIVMLEPLNGDLYKLGYTLNEDDAGYGMSPQELASSVRLAEPGEGSAEQAPTSEEDRPEGSFSGDIETFYPGRESVEIERKVTFRAGEQPVMWSKDTEDGVKFATSRVVLNGSWSGKQFKSTTQRVLSTEMSSGWVAEEIVITMMPYGVLRFESRWPYGDKVVEMTGNLFEE